MSETIKRIADKTKNFTIIANEALKRPDMSARAKGVFAYIMTLPNDWVIHKEELGKHFTEGRDAIDKAFKELVTAGYITLQLERNEKRQIVRYCYSIHEMCVPEEERSQKLTPRKLVTGNPETASPVPENPELLSTDLDQGRTNKETKHKHGEFGNVLLTSSELEKIKTSFPLDWEQRIKTMDEGIELKGYKYKSHYLAILKWAERDRAKSTPLFPDQDAGRFVDPLKGQINLRKP